MISGKACASDEPQRLATGTLKNFKKFGVSSGGFEVAARFDGRPLEASWNCSVFAVASERASWT